MALEYTVTTLPPLWPGKRNSHPARSRFKTRWTETLRLLEREVKHLGGRKVEIACDVQDRHLRNDGQLRADARPGYPVILSFLVEGQRLQFPCDTFAWWQDNLYAIAKALEALRMVERYGVSKTSQYAGFKALPATTEATMGAGEAARIVAAWSDTSMTVAHVLGNVESARTAYRAARNRAHPDTGGRAEDFITVQDAAKILGAHHGVSL